MAETAIDMVAGIGGNTVQQPRVLTAVWRGMRHMVVRIQADAALSCIDQRLREDAGVTPRGYLDAMLRR